MRAGLGVLCDAPSLTVFESLLKGDCASLDSGEDGNSGVEIARSTYAAYNGGPGAYNRWRRSDESADTRYIDQSFWTKFRAVTAGQLFDILNCAAQWGRSSVAAQAPHATPPASFK
jgi:hypothetical protein